MVHYPDILILRHGETEWNREGRFQGGYDSRLTPLGRLQALDQRRVLQEVDLSGFEWISSPQPRAVATAQIAKGRDAGITIDPDLREIGMGAWAGRLRRDIETANPELDLHGLAVYWHLPGGETPEDVAKRSRKFLDRLTAPSVIVTHGVTLRILVCVHLGHPVDQFDKIPADHGAVYRSASSCFELLARSNVGPARMGDTATEAD